MADSGEKTEKASPKKKKDAREKGETHKSMDLCASVTMVALFSVLRSGFDPFVTSFRRFTGGMLRGSFLAPQAAQLSTDSVQTLYRMVLFQILPLIIPLLAVAMVVGALTHVLQTGPMLTTKKLKPDFNKINPLSGWKRIFSTASIMELGKSTFKILILSYIVWRELRAGMPSYSRMMYLDVPTAFSQIVHTCFSMGVTIGMALTAFAGVDMLYQWWKFQKDLMMTKQEVKEENKQLEGNPDIKGKIKQKQRQMSAARMMQQVPSADVVITNPTHYAVALRYKQGQDSAPIVLAKGQDFLAQRIKKVAAENKIVMVENKPVARALYAACEVGQEIPAEMYQAIADILIYVYKVNNKL